MIEDIFLTYANNSLKEKPEKLLDMVKEFENQGFEFGWMDEERLYRIANIFRILVNRIDDKRVHRIHNKKPSTPFKYRRIDFEIAYDGIYRSENGYCEKCFENLTRTHWLGFDLFKGNNPLRCFECDQLFFKKILTCIVEGKEYAEIGPNECPAAGLPNALLNTYNEFAKSVSIVPDSIKSPFKQTMKEGTFYNCYSLHQYEEASNGGFVKGLFTRVFFYSFAMYSLVEFLLNNDRRKLKLCDECKKFFIAKKVDTRIKFCPECSPKSKMNREERRNYMRQRRAEKKKLKIEQQRKAQIKRFLEAGYSEKEAQEIWEIYKEENM